MTDIGHWYNSSKVPDEDLSNYAAFCYSVIFPNGDFYIGFKSIRSKKSKKEVYWRNYKSSSKIVKSREDLPEANFIILHVFDKHEDAYGKEEMLLREVSALQNEKCLNQVITHSEMLRRPESYTEEAVKNARKGLLEYRNSDRYVHPMQGKTHPNRGKTMPQTAPKKHVSLDNRMITNGEENKWWPKDQVLPEGYRFGMTTNRKDELTEKEKYTKKLISCLNGINSRIRYSLSPNPCSCCGVALCYERRNLKSCSKECWRELYRIRKDKKSANGDHYKRTEETKQRRLKRYAESKGFETYDQLATRVYKDLKSNSYVQVAESLDIAKSTVYNLKRYYESSIKDELN